MKERAVRIVKRHILPVGKSHHAAIRILHVPRCAAYPEGVKYSLTLVDDMSDERVFTIDNHGGHGHHMHISNEVRQYHYVDEQQLLRDFWAGVQVMLHERTAAED